MNELKQKELDLFYRYKKGDNIAGTELITSLKPLIIGQVNKFQNSGLPIKAMQLEGQRLALNSLTTYDPSKSQLNTHVTNHLKKLSRFVTTYQNVGYIPEPRALKIGSYQTILANLEADLGRTPTVVEIADEMNLSVKEVERLQSELRNDLSQQFKSDDEEDGGFFEYTSPTIQDPETNEAINFVYYDADPIDKRILESTLGLFGTLKKNNQQLELELKLSSKELNDRKHKLAEKIKSLI